MADDDLWYVAYGSNVSSERLQRYLDRHAARAGTLATPPSERRPMHLPHRLFFAHESTVWTGGIAFLDPEAGGGATRAVAWRLRREQFVAVLGLENRRPDLTVEREVFELAAGERRAVVEGRYGLVLGCDSPDGRPALTFTTPETPLPAENRPATAYVATIVAGLVAEHGLSEPAARSYVADRLPA